MKTTITKKLQTMFLLAALALFTVSCSKDDGDDNGNDPGNIPSNLIIGKWTLEKYVDETTYTNGSAPKTVTTPNDYHVNFEFTKEGKLLWTEDDDLGGEPYTEEHTYKVTGNKLIVDGEYEYPIEKLTRTELVFYETFPETNDDGVVIGTNKAYMHFKK